MSRRLGLRLAVASLVLLAALLLSLTTGADSTIYKVPTYGVAGDPLYDVSVDHESLHRAGRILSREGGTYFVYTPPGRPVLHGNLAAAIRYWALPALPLAYPRGARWIFSYKTARLVPPGLTPRHVYGVGAGIALVDVAR